MEKDEFKRVLFKVAFCSMACDGHIDDSEIKELHFIDKNTTYFSTIDLSDELDQLIHDFNNKGIKVIEELFNYLRNTKLNTIQELLVLEVALRIINADGIHDENEIRFLHLLRSKLELHDEVIQDRFGKLDILHTNEYSKNIIADNIEMEFMNNINVLEMTQDVIDKIKSHS